jgi:predicted PurR-regulated permease PerM
VFPRIADQVNDLIHKLPLGLERMRLYLNSRPWGQTLLQHLPGVLASANLTAEISTVAEKAFEGLAGLVVIAVVGLYAGASPSLYERGLLSLFPTRRRDRAREVLGEVAYTLRWWILGQLVPMGVLAIVTWIGLWLIGVNLAFTLGIFTGVMVFIPYIGSLIAFAVTLLAVLIQGPAQIWPVVLLYVGIHAAEGYLLTPLIQKRAVYVPPALTILAQMLMGLLLGFLGFALATPLTAAAMVGVKMLYLHERPEHH